MKGSKIVFTDIDGTLLEGFITLDLVNYLYFEGFFDSCQYQKQLELMNLFKSGKISFLDWLEKWASVWGQGIKNKSQFVLNQKAKIFFKSYNKIYPSSKKLVKYFHDKGYLVIGISAGVIEADNLIKDYLSLDEIISSKVSVKNGVYTGQVTTKLHKKNGKKNYILSYSKKNKIDLLKCIGIGDSILDVSFIDLMGTKLALNFNKIFVSEILKKEYFISNHNSILKDIKKII
ncbi:MAG: haloacid dehalogenase-like hydrolase [Sphaerochaetaceae bacterium]|nr:haloacid dehalogenase-like hydrolase [Sphaerochaetaceae bacterium]